MKVLLDNCVDRRFVQHLAPHDVHHVLRHGWERLSNGRLLTEAQRAGYEVLVIVDKGMRFQQNLSGRTIALLTLDLPRVDYESLQLVVGSVVNLLDTGIIPGSSSVIKHPER